jgi:uncharacterized protein YqgC (DUF456 family)
MSKLGATLGGASFRALLAGLGLGIVGGVVGLVLGIIGTVSGLPFLAIGIAPCAIIGAVLGVFLVERHVRDDWREALKATGGWAIGCVLSGVAQFLISLLMIALFLWQALKG